VLVYELAREDGTAERATEGEARSLTKGRRTHSREYERATGKERERERKRQPMRGAERGTGRGPKSGAIALSDVAISEYANHYLACAARTYLEREREREREREKERERERIPRITRY